MQCCLTFWQISFWILRCWLNKVLCTAKNIQLCFSREQVSRLQKIYKYFGMFVTLFSVNINALSAGFQVECVEVQSYIQLRNLIVSLY